MVERKNIAIALKSHREKAELTQGELAKRLGVSRQSVISLEGGKCVPSVVLALKISRFFGTPVEFIFQPFDDEDEKNNINGGDMSKDILPWSPWREMSSLRETIDRLFDEPNSAPSRVEGQFFRPTVGIRETDKQLVIEADIPGVKEGEVDVEIEDDKVTIRGERKYKDEVKRDQYYHLETSYGSFSRVIGLPSYVDSEKSEAEIKDGILTITIPKVEQRKPKKITVKSKKI
jgi:HSP20 family protein